MPFEKRIEQHGVAILQRPEEHVPAQIGDLRRVLHLDALQLGVEVLDDRWEQSVETETATFLRGERGALVHVPIRQDRSTAGSSRRCHRRSTYGVDREEDAVGPELAS